MYASVSVCIWSYSLQYIQFLSFLQFFAFFSFQFLTNTHQSFFAWPLTDLQKKSYDAIQYNMQCWNIFPSVAIVEASISHYPCTCTLYTHHIDHPNGWKIRLNQTRRALWREKMIIIFRKSKNSLFNFVQCSMTLKFR